MTTRRSFLKSLLGVATTVVAPSTVLAEIAPTLKKFGEESSRFSGEDEYLNGYVDEIKITKGSRYSNDFDPYGGDFTVEAWFHEGKVTGWAHKASVREGDLIKHYENGVVVKEEPYFKEIIENKWSFIQINKPERPDFFLHNAEHPMGFPISKRM